MSEENIRTVADFGPRYAETDLSRFPVEPWNTFSDVIFLLIIVLFAARTRLNLRRHPFIVSALPLLLVGAIGGLLYHATRSSNLWLILDFMPIAILCFGAFLYLWFETLRIKPAIFRAASIIFVGANLLAWTAIRPQLPNISLTYALLAADVVASALVHCAARAFRSWRLLALAALLITFAIAAREYDAQSSSVLPMGSHFLWHLFGGASVFALMEYCYRADLERVVGRRS